MKRVNSIPLALAACLLLAACGFQLRGADSVGLGAERIYLDTSGAGDTGREVREQLRLTDTTLTETAGDADYILRINNQRFDREVLSVSPRTGNVEEYELILSAMLSVATGKGETRINNELLAATRDLIFDETAVIATGDEQELLREEMTRQIADQALLRARAVIRNYENKTAAAAAAE